MVLSTPSKMFSQSFLSEIYNTKQIVFGDVKTKEEKNEILLKLKYGEVFSYYFQNEVLTVNFINYKAFYLSYNSLLGHKNMKIGLPSIYPFNITNCISAGARRSILIHKLLSNEENQWLENKEIDYFNTHNNQTFITFQNTLTALDFVCKFEFKFIFVDNKHISNSQSKVQNMVRTLYIGKVEEDITEEDLFNSIKGGLIYSLKIIRDKKCAFITFVDPMSAFVFKEFAAHNPIIIKNHKLKINFGSETIINPAVITTLYKNGTRTLFMANIDKSITEPSLRSEFESYGKLELVIVSHSKKVAFINFCYLTNAFKAYEDLHEKYNKMNLSFTNDRCANQSHNSLLFQLADKYPEAPIN